MIYRLRHRTTYTYEREVTYARCVLRLTPRSSETQTVWERAITITPQPSQLHKRKGPFGEETQTVVIDQPHDELTIEARALVEVHVPPVEAPADSLPWECVRAASFAAGGLDAESPASYLYPTARTPIVNAITDFARPSFSSGRPIIEAASDLMRRMHEGFIFDAEATTVSTPVAEAFAARRGVCQDFAHIMISGLHGLGVPAAYVSGYLRTRPPPGRPRLEGSDATHAWASVWCGADRGWIGFDPTNALLVQDDHIVLAVGRDYADVAPIDGLLLGPGEQALKVEVDVIPEEESRAATPRALSAHSVAQ